jgi:hypothetical protein
MKEMHRMVCSGDRFYVLDEGYRLVLAPPACPEDPINRFYEATTASDVLPPEIERAVRALTRGWDRDGVPREASALVRGVRVFVAPLQGPVGPHFAVRFESSAA